MSKINFKDIFENNYPGYEVFITEVLKPIFNDTCIIEETCANLLRDEEDIERAKRANITKVLKVASIEPLDGFEIEVYDITVNNNCKISRSRRQIQDFVRSNTFFSRNIFMLFHYEEPQDKTWRFSFAQKGDTIAGMTSAKRYTYLFGKNLKCRTADDRFNQLIGKTIDNKALEEAFSVEALSKEFYNKLFDWFQWAISDEIGIRFPNLTNTPDDDREGLEIRIVRLITRLMFVWFIKQKGFVPDYLFNEEELNSVLKDFDPQSKTDGRYYNAILQNLFFATLNSTIKDENGNGRAFAEVKNNRDVKSLYRYKEYFAFPETTVEKEVINLFAPVPFLNGGLFECLDKSTNIDGVQYALDGFSRNTTKDAQGNFKHRAFIPNIVFFDEEKGLFPLLKQYNFTIEENTPTEQQVALDPELLGKVFENLLGYINPETKESARNASGSFYTPRLIVNYMIDETLAEYIGQNEKAKQILSNDFIYNENDKEYYKKISEKLFKLRILDPACGSGAFPMGLLNRMIEILQNINPALDTYETKLHIIENCIYGVDIQPIALQIAKLRFFISLVCDMDEINMEAENYGVPTLPNLETKFVAANSLISKKKRAKGIEGFIFENPEIETTKTELEKIRHQHFAEKSAIRKKKLRLQDEKLREHLADLLAENEFVEREDAKQLASWNPYDQNNTEKFFDPEWMFGVADGFDIVIGNPPYIQLQENAGKLAKMYEDCKYKTFARTGDIYCLFYERGYQLLKAHGHLCFITSNKWMRAGYGENTRKFFSETNPKLLIDFKGNRVFENATVDVNILLLEKAKNQCNTKALQLTEKNRDALQKMSLFLQQHHTRCTFQTADSWVILSPIEQSIKQKIESVGKPLKEWDVQINYGIKTGCNEAFIINEDKRNEILSKCTDDNERHRTEEIIRPILRGRDIKRYGYEWAELYLIATFPACHYDIEQYPALKNYLLSFGKERLEQTGQTYLVDGQKIKARKKTNNKWFETQDSISYWEDFSKPKVMWKIIGCNINFSFDDTSKVCNNAVNIMTGRKDSLLQFVGLMNSKLFDWYLKLTTEAEVQGGGIQLYVTTLEKTLLKLDHKFNFSEIIEARLSGKVTDDEVNKAVFKVYNLTNEEINYINFCKQVDR